MLLQADWLTCSHLQTQMKELCVESLLLLHPYLDYYESLDHHSSNHFHSSLFLMLGSLMVLYRNMLALLLQSTLKCQEIT